jgi:anti-sigma factor RsiW
MNAEENSRTCSKLEARLEDYLGGQLSGADAKEVAEHLKQCESCSAALEDAQASVRLLQFAERAPQPGPGFPRIVMARIRTELDAARDGRGVWQLFVSLAWRFAATATLTLALMVTYDVVHRRQPQPNMTIARSGELRDMFTSDADRVPTTRDDVLLMVAEKEHANR